MNLRILKIVSGLAVATAIQFHFGSVALGATKNVTTSGFSFVPSSVTISVGDSVTWTGLSTIHNVETDSDPFCGGPPGSNGACTKTFIPAGTLDYCFEAHRFSVYRVGPGTVEGAGRTAPADTDHHPVE